MSKITFVTTFNQDGYQRYAKRFLDGFIKHFPKEVNLVVFTEQVTSKLPKVDNILYMDLLAIKECADFKKRHKDNPAAHGVRLTPDGDKMIDYRFQAVKFSHIIFALTELVNLETDWLIRIGADVIIEKDVPLKVLENKLFTGLNLIICHYLGRCDWPHSETDFLAFNMKHQNAKNFLNYFRSVYTTDDVFKLQEHTDSWIFDEIRKANADDENLFHNISEGLPGLDVWPQTWLGDYMTHLKGPVAKMKNEDKQNLVSDTHRDVQLIPIIEKFKPVTIVETGTGDGERALVIVKKMLEKKDAVHYCGFDLFEDMTDDIQITEKCGPGYEKNAIEGKLQILSSKMKEHNKVFTFSLFKGNTNETLAQWTDTEYFLDERIGKIKISNFDVAIIGGGKSIETIKNDYDYLKNCKMVVIDSIYSKDENGDMPDIDKWGANKLIKTIAAKTIPLFASNRLHAGGHVNMHMTGIGVSQQVQHKIKTQNCTSDPHIQEHIRHSTKFSKQSKIYQIDKLQGEKEQLEARQIELDLALRNIENLPNVNWVESCETHKLKAVIISGGPSITDSDHEQYKKNWSLIRKYYKQKNCRLFVVKTAHDQLIEAGIIPFGCFLLDPRDHVQDFIENPHPDVKYITASMCAKSTWDRLLERNAQIWGYHAAVGAKEQDVLVEISPKAQIIGGGSSSATRGIGVARVLGFQNFVILGQDSCYFKPVDMNKKDHQGRPAYLEAEVNGKKFTTDPQLLAACQDMEMIMKTMMDCEFEIPGNGMVSHIYKVLRPKLVDFEELINTK